MLHGYATSTALCYHSITYIFASTQQVVLEGVRLESGELSVGQGFTHHLELMLAGQLPQVQDLEATIDKNHQLLQRLFLLVHCLG